MMEARNEVCGYEYETRTENAFIKGLGVDYDKTKVLMSRLRGYGRINSNKMTLPLVGQHMANNEWHVYILLPVLGRVKGGLSPYTFRTMLKSVV